MEAKELSRFQYYLLTSTTPPDGTVNLHNKVYSFWKKVISDAMALTGYDSSNINQDFIRQNIISCICHDGEPVAALLFSFFNIESSASLESNYFKDNYSDIFVQKLRKQNIKSVMALQYLAIDPRWRGKAKPPIHCGLALVGLSNRVRDEFNIDSSIAPARADHKVNEICYSFGATCIIPNQMSHNSPCDLLACIRGKTHPHASPEVREVEEYLWRNRLDYTGNMVQRAQKKAA